jgi:hypothetical protein
MYDDQDNKKTIEFFIQGQSAAAIICSDDIQVTAAKSSKNEPLDQITRPRDQLVS